MPFHLIHRVKCYLFLTSAKLISTGVARPKSSTSIVTVCFCALTLLMTPCVSSQAPAMTTTVSPGSKSTRTFGFGALVTTPPLMPSGLISSAVSGTGLLPGPTNPVTPRVLRTTYQVSSFMIMLTRT